MYRSDVGEEEDIGILGLIELSDLFPEMVSHFDF